MHYFNSRGQNGWFVVSFESHNLCINNKKSNDYLAIGTSVIFLVAFIQGLNQMYN